MLRLVSLLVLIVNIKALSVVYTNKLRVHVFFESYCLDSLDFFSKQLLPNLDAFNNHLEIILVPFGKTKISNGLLICPNGPKVCKMNRIISCALLQIPDQRSQVKYVEHQIRWNTDTQFNEKTFGLDWSVVSSCSKRKLGKYLQLAAETEQNRIIGTIQFVPTIVFNEDLDRSLQNQILYDFKEAVCEYFENSLEVCQETNKYD